MSGLVLLVELLEARELVHPNPQGPSHPYAVIQLNSQGVTSTTVYATDSPRWRESWELWAGATSEGHASLCGGHMRQDDTLRLQICSERADGRVDTLGHASIPLLRLGREVIDEWVELHGVAVGSVRLRTTPRHYEADDLGPIPRGFDCASIRLDSD